MEGAGRACESGPSGSEPSSRAYMCSSFSGFKYAQLEMSTCSPAVCSWPMTC